MEIERRARGVEKGNFVLLNKGKDSKDESNNYRGICFPNVPGKWIRVLTERLMKVTEGKVSSEQEGFRKGKGCENQFFAIKMMVYEYLV